MRRLPVWMLSILVVLTGLLLWVGIDERHEVGPLPTVLGVLWALFILGSLPKIFTRDDRH